MLVSIFIAMSTILATSQAGLPETCHTRGEINAPGLILDETKWGTAEDITTDQQADTTNKQNTAYNELLKSWLLNPTTSDGLNPDTSDRTNALIADNLPGACRLVFTWIFVSLCELLGGIWREATSLVMIRPACAQPRRLRVRSVGLGVGGTRFQLTLLPSPPLSPALTLPRGSITFCPNSSRRGARKTSLSRSGSYSSIVLFRYNLILIGMEPTPARGSLPFGVYGLAIIGGGKADHAQMAQQIKIMFYSLFKFDYK